MAEGCVFSAKPASTSTISMPTTSQANVGIPRAAKAGLSAAAVPTQSPMMALMATKRTCPGEIRGMQDLFQDRPALLAEETGKPAQHAMRASLPSDGWEHQDRTSADR